MNLIINPYPSKYRLPGERARERRHLPVIAGPRGVIAHSFTYHGLPSDADARLDSLPSNRSLSHLGQIKKVFLSFTVYSLKEMHALGHINSDLAFDLFDAQYRKIDQLNEDNYLDVRKNLYDELWGKNICVKEFSDAYPKLAGDRTAYELFLRGGNSALRKEYAKTYDYKTWQIDPTIKYPNGELAKPYLQDEYTKALWLEMRLIEKQIGLSLGCDEDKFIIGNNDGYSSKNGIESSIDIFRYRAIDCGIKAESGHWMFDLYEMPVSSPPKMEPFDWGRAAFIADPYIRRCNPIWWVSELMDRMNASSYSSSVNLVMSALSEGIGMETLPPELRAFTSGGLFITSLRTNTRGFPIYPYGLKEKNGYRRHTYAEYFDRLIRSSIMSIPIGQIKGEDIYSLYRKSGLYIAILNLEGYGTDEMEQKITNLDIAEIERYFSEYKSRTERAFIKLLANNKTPKNRRKAAEIAYELWETYFSVIPEET